jgi:SSS family solute:Na+ symporter
MLCALVPGSMLLIVSATTVARNVYKGLNPGVSDATVTTLTKSLVPVIALGAVAFVFAGGQTIVTLLLLGYALVTQLFPALIASLIRPGWVTREGAMAGIVSGVGIVAAMSFSGATPGSSTTVDSLIGGLPGFLAQLNLGVLALVVNVVVTGLVSMATRRAAPEPVGARSRFQRQETRVDTGARG